MLGPAAPRSATLPVRSEAFAGRCALARLFAETAESGRNAIADGAENGPAGRSVARMQLRGRSALRNIASLDGPDGVRDDEQHQKYEEEHLRDFRRGPSDSGEAKHASDKSDDEEDERPA